MQTNLETPNAPAKPVVVSSRRLLLQVFGVGAVTLGGVGLAASGLRLSVAQEASIWNNPDSPIYGRRDWINSSALGPADLNGKVVMVNFCTYSCINTIRTLPYLRAWDAKYRDRGLVVLGVHTPEFVFEHDLANVRDAIADLGIAYPVVLDNDFGIWRSFSNNAWPGFYLVGIDGRVRHRQLGEGTYDQLERVIQRLLSEGNTAVADEIHDVPGEGAQAAPDWANLRTPETYAGYARTTGFVSPGGLRADTTSEYQAPSSLALNRWSLSGSWLAGREFATLIQPGGAIQFRFHARDLHLVFGLEDGVGPVRYRVTIDGEPPGAHHGVDTDAEGFGRIDKPWMHQLVRQQRAIVDRTFGIEFLDPGVRAYAFTFG